MQKTWEAIHLETVKLAKQHRHIEAKLILNLQKVNQTKLFQKLGFSSLYQYCTQALKLNEGTSYNLIAVARKAAKLPALQKAVQSNELSISQARRIVPILKSSNAQQWIEKAQTLSQRNLEKEIAAEYPQLITKEQARYVAKERLELKIGVSEELMQNFKFVQDLVSQSKQKPANLEATLKAVLDFYLEKKDPIKKANRAKCRKSVQKKPDSSQVIPARILHAVKLRDSYRCSFRDKKGARCESRRWLDAHHIKHKSLGGKNSLKNLQLLCRSHHQLLHEGKIPI